MSSRSAPLAAPFSGVTLDRASTLRADASWVAERFAEPASRVVAASSDGVLVDAGTAEPRLARRAPSRQSGLSLEAVEPMLLGLEDGGALLGPGRVRFSW